MESLIFQQTPVVHLPSMSVASVTLLVLTAQAVIYGFMLWQMIKTARATTKAADATQESAKAATRAVAFAERTQPIIERAVVLVESVIATNLGVGAVSLGASAIGALSGHSMVFFILKNFGRTAAYSVKLTGVLTGVGNFPIEESPPTIIAPQGDLSWRSKPLRDWIDDELIKTINVGLSVLRYQIDVSYVDAFGSYRYISEGQYEPALQRFVVTANRESETAT